MIPIRDLNPTSRTALVTVVFLIANVGIYFVVQGSRTGREIVPVEDPDTGLVTDVDVPADLSFTLEWAAIPCEVVTGEPSSLEELGATFNDGDETACSRDDSSPPLHPDKHVWLAVIVSMFLHGGLLHLAGNMLYLWIFGNNVEDRLGPIGFIAFYVAGGIAATLAHIAVQPDSTVPLVGASGAIAAVMGAYLVWYPNAPIRTVVVMLFLFFTEIRAKWLLLFWFALQFFTDAGSSVAWVAHVGGFVFGVAAGLALRNRGRPRPVAFRY